MHLSISVVCVVGAGTGWLMKAQDSPPGAYQSHTGPGKWPNTLRSRCMELALVLEDVSRVNNV